MTLFYEMSVHFLLMVFVAFWVVEFPISFNYPRHYIFGTPEYIGFFFAHTIPEILVALEFFNSRVRFEWRRFWLYFCIGAVVLGINIVVSYTSVNPYASLDWEDNLGLAIPMALLMFVL